MKTVLLPLIAVAVILAAVGCGGGAASVAPTTTVRQIQPGDEVRYEIVSDSSDRVAEDKYVTYRYSTSDKTPLYGDRMLKLTISRYYAPAGHDVLNDPDFFNPENARYNLVEYVEQASDGTVFTRGSEDGNDPLPAITGNPVRYPSPTAVGESFSYTFSYTGRNRQTSTEVLAFELKDGYPAFKIREDTHGGGVVGVPDFLATLDSWFVPELGCMVRSESYDPTFPQLRVITKIIYRNF